MSDDNIKDINLPPQFRNLNRNLRVIIVAIILILVVTSSFFTIGPEEIGVVIRLGKFQRNVVSGLNFKIPFFEQVYKVPVERQLKQEFGFRTVNANVQTRYSQKNFQEESLMLSGDLNLATVEWVVQYRINDPYKYLFKVRGPEQTLRDISEAAMRQIVGDRTVNEVLTFGRAEVASELEVLIQKIMNDYETGIKIEQIVLQDVNPPDPVKPSFNGVNQAQQEREKLINEALSGYNQIIPRAEGEALQTLQQAEGYAIDRVNRSRGEAARFNQLYAEYVKAPEVTRKRIYLETIEEILPKIGNKVIVDENGKNVLPLLNIQTKAAAAVSATSLSNNNN
jgi:membrane protease subunit HflK